MKRAIIPPTPDRPPINIWGERNVEWSFLSTEMPDGPGEAIEFGCEQGYMSLLAAQKGFHVVANDLQDSPLRGNIRMSNFAREIFLTLEFLAIILISLSIALRLNMLELPGDTELPPTGTKATLK